MHILWNNLKTKYGWTTSKTQIVQNNAIINIGYVKICNIIEKVDNYELRFDVNVNSHLHFNTSLIQTIYH